MSEDVTPLAAVTAGQLLREARLAAGVHIEALATTLKVPVHKLEALEADDFAALPDVVFARALASSVCRTLGANPAHVMALLPQSGGARLSVDVAGINTPLKFHRGRLGRAGSLGSRWLIGIAIVALLAGAVAVFYFPDRDMAGSQVASPVADPTGHSSTAAATTSRSLSNVTVMPLGPTGPAVQPAGNQGAPAPGAALEAGKAGLAPVALAPGAALVGTAASEQTALPAEVLVLKARGASWVQVKDASGAVVLERNLAQGETLTVPGLAPYAVVIGRADVTEVLVRGRPYDLLGVSRENVARFEVK